LIPDGVRHDFENHGAEECGFISINAPAGFEQMMPGIVEWLAENPLTTLADAQEAVGP
jgi:23S rRNA A2030 N6-methylase RlmJ